jgi:hypothetical protein
MPGSPKWSFSLTFSHQNPVYTTPLLHRRYMPRSVLNHFPSLSLIWTLLIQPTPCLLTSLISILISSRILTSDLHVNSLCQISLETLSVLLSHALHVSKPSLSPLFYLPIFCEEYQSWSTLLYIILQPTAIVPKAQTFSSVASRSLYPLFSPSATG